MIEIYPSRLDGEPLERHSVSEPTTLRVWLEINAPDVSPDELPITININGQIADIDRRFTPSDLVQVWVEPGYVGAVVAAVVAVIAVAVAMATRPKVPKPTDQTQGKPLESASLSSNMAKYGDPIPEIAGAPPRIYPNYLVPPRQYYTAPREQWVEALFCIGKGKYDKSLAGVYVGDTRAVALGNDCVINFYEPGEDVSGDTASDWWHEPKEVGFTSRGGSGLELGTIRGRTSGMSASSFRVIGDTVIAEGGVFPDDWGVGVQMRIEVPVPFTVTAGSPRDVIGSVTGFEHYEPAPGERIEFTGDISGIYEVAGFYPASEEQPAEAGTPSTYTGSVSPQTSFVGESDLSLELAGLSVSITLSGDFESEQSLVDHINGHLVGLGYNARLNDSGHIELYELAPYSGMPFLVGGDAALSVFGDDPVSDIGEPTTPLIPAGVASITLNTLDGQPVSGLPRGDIVASAAPEGMAYEIVSAPNNVARAVSMVDHQDWAGWPEITSDEISVSLSAHSAQIGWTGPFSVTPPGEACTAFEVDYTFPNGLIHYNKKGRVQRISATIYVQWRAAGGDWVGVKWTHTDGTPDGMGFTRRVNLPGGIPLENVEVRMRRSPKLGWSNTSEDIQWTGLRGRMLGAPKSYDGVTTMSVKLRTGDRVSSQVDNKIWLKAKRILPGLDGVERPTSDIAPFLMHMFRTCGYEQQVDIEALAELDEIWSRRQDTFNLAVDKHATVKRLANDCLRPGFAELVIDRGLLTPVRDARRESVNYIYTPQEMVSLPTVISSMIEPDEIDGVDAEYIDEKTGKMETIKFRLPGDEGRRAEKIQLPGVTNWTRAWRLASRHRRVIAYRRTRFKATTELHALNSSYMSLDRFQEGVPAYGQSAFIVARDGNKLTVSEPFDWADDASRPGAGRVVAFRHMDGRVTPPQWINRGDNDYEIILIDNPQIDIHLGDSRDPTMVYFGVVGKWAHDILITNINPKSDNTVDIEAVEYDDRVYADDDRDPKNEVYLTTEVYRADELTSFAYEAENKTSLLFVLEDEDAVSVNAASTRLKNRIALVEEASSEGISGMELAVARLSFREPLVVVSAEAESVHDVNPTVERIKLSEVFTHQLEASEDSLATCIETKRILLREARIDYDAPPEDGIEPLLAPQRIKLWLN